MFTVINSGDSEYRLLYAAKEFKTGLAVVGYLIYPDATVSQLYPFTEIGDGIYTATISHVKKTNAASEKYGIVMKEDGIVKKFETILFVH